MTRYLQAVLREAVSLREGGEGVEPSVMML